MVEEALKADSDQQDTLATARVRDSTGHSPANRATGTAQASSLALLLEGIRFPATKGEIRSHINARSHSEIGTRDYLSAVEDNLRDNVLYSNTHDIELAMGLANKSGGTEDESPYVRDKALNRANDRRVGERIRPDSYTEKKESVGIASMRDVSPNTPRGESV